MLGIPAYRPIRLAYQPPASTTFLSEQTSHQQSANNTFLSEQISTNHQPSATSQTNRLVAWCKKRMTGTTTLNPQP
jgi:hypothetical protein